MCHAYSSKEQEKGKATGFNRDVWKDFVKSKGGSGEWACCWVINLITIQVLIDSFFVSAGGCTIQ